MILWFLFPLVSSICGFFIDYAFDVALSMFLILILIFGIMFMFPLIYLYVDYKKNDKNLYFDVIKYNDFIYKKEFREIKFSGNDILKCEAFLTYSIYEGRIRWLFWDEYFYYKVSLKNGETLIITCLTFDKLESYLSKNLIHKKKVYFPYIR